MREFAISLLTIRSTADAVFQDATPLSVSNGLAALPMQTNFLARSVSTVTIAMISLSGELMKRFASLYWHLVAIHRKLLGERFVWDREVAFNC